MEAQLKSGKIVKGRQADLFVRIGIAKEIESDAEESNMDDSEVQIPKRKPGRKKKQ